MEENKGQILLYQTVDGESRIVFVTSWCSMVYV